MTFDNVVEMRKPDSYSQFRLKDCSCGSGEVVYLNCSTADGRTAWEVMCMDCGAKTKNSFVAAHDAQLEWNEGRNILRRIVTKEK